MAKKTLCQRAATEIFVGEDESIVIKQMPPNEEEQLISFDRRDAALIIEMINEACNDYDELVKED